MTLTKQTEVIVEEHIHFTKNEGNMVLLNYDTGTYFGLDPMGAQFWKLFAEHRSVGQVINILLAEYDVAEEVLWKDIEQLVTQWQEKGLIKVVQSA